MQAGFLLHSRPKRLASASLIPFLRALIGFMKKFDAFFFTLLMLGSNETDVVRFLLDTPEALLSPKDLAGPSFLDDLEADDQLPLFNFLLDHTRCSGLLQELASRWKCVNTIAITLLEQRGLLPPNLSDATNLFPTSVAALRLLQKKGFKLRSEHHKKLEPELAFAVQFGDLGLFEEYLPKDEATRANSVWLRELLGSVGSWTAVKIAQELPRLGVFFPSSLFSINRLSQRFSSLHEKVRFLLHYGLFPAAAIERAVAESTTLAQSKETKREDVEHYRQMIRLLGNYAAKIGLKLNPTEEMGRAGLEEEVDFEEEEDLEGWEEVGGDEGDDWSGESDED